MLRALIEAYVKALVESDEELQVEFAAAGGGAIAGMTSPLGETPPPYVKRRRKRNKKQ